MKRAFTLVEIMVATMLLAMLVTILTMIFNQSSIAWTTGVASVTALGEAREDMSLYSMDAENALLGDDGSQVLKVASVWDEGGEGLRKTGRTLKTAFEKLNASASNFQDPADVQQNTFPLNGQNAKQHESFLVGVMSYGPDGKTGGDYSWDDISTMPEEVVR